MTQIETLGAPSALSPIDARAIMTAMRKTVRGVLTFPLVWETALAIIEDVPARHEDEQAQAFRDWIAEHFRFVNDPIDVQLLKSPVYLLAAIRDRGFVQGNCADAAMLAAALCESVRIRCNYVSVAFNDAHAAYSHVFTMAYPHMVNGAQAAVEFDVTRPPGLPRANFSRHLEISA